MLTKRFAFFMPLKRTRKRNILIFGENITAFFTFITTPSNNYLLYDG